MRQRSKEVAMEEVSWKLVLRSKERSFFAMNKPGEGGQAPPLQNQEQSKRPFAAQSFQEKPERSLVAQGFDGIDLGGAARRDIGGKERDGGKQRRDADKSQGIGWLDAEEQAGHKAGQDKRRGHAENQPISVSKTPCFNTSPRMFDGCAPRAIRRPNSFERRATE
jgi:hypothetical protein